MLAVHSSRQDFRPANPMAITSMLNGHARSNTSNDFGMLLNVGQKPLPPIVVPEDCFDRSTSLGHNPQPYAYRYQHHQSSISSMESSPPPSVASSTSRRGSVARAPRPKYSDDQGYFIWYHRTDLAEPWDKVLQEFAKQFNHRRPKGGLQCKFYRLLGDWGVEKVREQARQSQSRSRDRIGQYGLVQRTSLRFDWMRPEHMTAPSLPQFATGHQVVSGEVPCPGCDDCFMMRTHDSAKPCL